MFTAMGKIKIGVCLKSLGLPFRRALQEVQKLGVTGVELEAIGDFAPNNLSQTGRRELRHLFSSHNLELSAIACPLRRGLDVMEKQEARIDYLRQAMTLGFDLGPRLVIVHPGKIPVDEKDPGLNRMTEALTALAQHGDRTGSILALETGLEDGPTLDRFLARFDTGSLGVNFNPANLLMSGFSPYEAGRVLNRRIVHAHAKDARTSTAGRSAQEQEVPLGHGDLDWLELLGILEEIDYHQWLVVERNGSLNPLADVSGAVKFLHKLTGR
jgi:L-ribulose-5-phosphate 3-epimerase